MSTTYTISSFLGQVRAAIASSDELTTLTGNTASPQALSYLPGATSGKCDLFHAHEYTIAFGATTTIDLAGVGVADPLGVITNVTWARLLAMAVFVHASPAGASLTVGGNATPVPIFTTGATTKIIFNSASGGLLMWGGGEPGVLIVGGASDKINFLNNDGALSIVFDLVLIGRSA